MPNSPQIVCRDSSVIAFNQRVLAQAQDPQIPLLERLKFLCIVSSNLDEFFEIRMAYLRRENPSPDETSGLSTAETIAQVRQHIQQLVQAQYHIFNHTLLPELAQAGIHFYRRRTWTAEQKQWLEQYFNREVLPLLTPIGLDVSHPFPRLLNKSLNFVVKLDGKDAFGRASGMAIVQAPRVLPRVLRLPETLCDGQIGLVFLSSIVHEFVHKLFRGMSVQSCHQFRVTRDSDLTVEEYELTNLRSAIQSELRDRNFGAAVRLEVADDCPSEIIDFLLKQFDLTQQELYQVNGPVNLVRLMSVPDMLDLPALKFPPFTPNYPIHLRKAPSLLDEIAKQDILLHHPYQSFEPIVRFIQDAAHAPDVVAIKMTIYRTGNTSALAQALLAAVQAGKLVTVVVELMARFDEENNVQWARKLEKAGAHVVYGVFGYKIHAKMALVIRREASGSLKSYAHLSTGNYHQANSRLYTDFGLLTADPDITRDVNNLFMEITGLGQANKLKKLYQSPFTLKPMLLDKIQREIQHAQAGKPAQIIAKLNALLDPEIIDSLYQASAAGVQIDLIIRGICTLRPQVAGLSDNIRVRSIIGRLLEHSRVYYFHDDGAGELFLSSADWMPRNFHRRIEIAIPILAPHIKHRIMEEGLKLPLNDTQKAWQMNPDGSYQKITPTESQNPMGVQEFLLQHYNY